MSTTKGRVVGLVVAVVVLLLGGFWAGISFPRSTAEPAVIAGTVRLVAVNGRSFVLRPNGSDISGSYLLGSIPEWRDPSDAWHQGGLPACLTAGSSGQQVTIGIIYVRASDNAPGGALVSWVECSS